MKAASYARLRNHHKGPNSANQLRELRVFAVGLGSEAANTLAAKVKERTGGWDIGEKTAC